MSIFDSYLHSGKLSNESFNKLCEISITKMVAKNEIIQQPGSLCRTIYFVRTGIARIYYFNKGIDITEHFSFSGDIIVRAESLFTNQPTPKGIQAMDPCELVCLDANKLESLYDQHRDIERLFRFIFESEHVNAIKRLESIQFKTAAERYDDLMQHTEIIKNIPLKYIASYLGITQVSLSRIRSQK